MDLKTETRNTLTYLSGLALLLSQGVVTVLGGTASELVIGAALVIIAPETFRLLFGRNGGTPS